MGGRFSSVLKFEIRIRLFDGVFRCALGDQYWPGQPLTVALVEQNELNFILITL